jgi:hypothetical protein
MPAMTAMLAGVLLGSAGLIAAPQPNASPMQAPQPTAVLLPEPLPDLCEAPHSHIVNITAGAVVDDAVTVRKTALSLQRAGYDTSIALLRCDDAVVSIWI